MHKTISDKNASIKNQLVITRRVFGHLEPGQRQYSYAVLVYTGIFLSSAIIKSVFNKYIKSTDLQCYNWLFPYKISIVKSGYSVDKNVGG